MVSCRTLRLWRNRCGRRRQRGKHKFCDLYILDWLWRRLLRRLPRFPCWSLLICLLEWMNRLNRLTWLRCQVAWCLQRRNVLLILLSSSRQFEVTLAAPFTLRKKIGGPLKMAAVFERGQWLAVLCQRLHFELPRASSLKPCKGSRSVWICTCVGLDTSWPEVDQEWFLRCHGEPPSSQCRHRVGHDRSACLRKEEAPVDSLIHQEYQD
mmetsp:Transcript_21877/g.47725  ORF Transcript_21877/g.47725 Transcript_21877/m.47725 type:complete len:209 (-) Transcript_21877:396-1022(-)